MLALLSAAGPSGTAVASALQPSALGPQPSTVDYGLFGPLHLSRPSGELRHTVLLFSDRDGWTARQQGIGDALAARGAFVVGIDLPAYLKRMVPRGASSTWRIRSTLAVPFGPYGGSTFANAISSPERRTRASGLHAK